MESINQQEIVLEVVKCVLLKAQGLLHKCFVCIVQGVQLQVYCRKYLMFIMQGVL